MCHCARWRCAGGGARGEIHDFSKTVCWRRDSRINSQVRRARAENDKTRDTMSRAYAELTQSRTYILDTRDNTTRPARNTVFRIWNSAVGFRQKWESADRSFRARASASTFSGRARQIAERAYTTNVTHEIYARGSRTIILSDDSRTNSVGLLLYYIFYFLFSSATPVVESHSFIVMKIDRGLRGNNVIMLLVYLRRLRF